MLACLTCKVRTLEVCEVALLVEASLVQAERVDDIDDLLRSIVGALLSLLGRCVGTSVCGMVSPKLPWYSRARGIKAHQKSLLQRKSSCSRPRKQRRRST
jgi:hypothetical protein